MIIDTFNGVFLAFLGICFALWLVLWLVFRKKSEKAKRTIVIALYVFVIVLFIGYKILLSLDGEYVAQFKGGSFNWWSELPFNLCNIAMILIPIAVATRKRVLLAFCFYFGFFFGFMALLTPEAGFAGFNVFLARNIGFYFTHFMIMLAPFFLLSFGIFVPSWKDILYAFILLALIACALHGVNTVLRATELHTISNYGFTYEPFGPILGTMWSLTPLPLIYLFPGGLIIIGAYMALVTGVVKLCRLPLKNK